MSDRLELSVENTLDSVAAAARTVSRFAEEVALSPRKSYQLDLVFEELMTNLVKYSYDDSARHQITVALENRDDVLTLTITHDGMDFNPWQSPDPDLAVPLEQRSEGGIGIYLVRKFSRSVDYERRDSRSIITVRF